MAKKILTLDQSRAKLVERLDHPLWKVYDSKAKVYRFYADREIAEQAETMLATSSLSAELILAQEFEITAPAPYNVSILNYTDGVTVLEGTQGTYVDYEFQTVDGNGTPLNEWVDVSYTFTNNGVSEQTADAYEGGTKVHKLVDQWLKPGVNTITIIATGRTSKQQSSPVVLTYTIVTLGVTSTFDVAKAYDKNATGAVPMLITYRTWGAYDKYVEFYLDSQIVSNATAFVSAANDMSYDTSVARNADLSERLSSDKHTLQVRTRATINNKTFYSKTLFYEFVVTGKQQIQVTIALELPSGTLINDENPLILTAEQFKAFSLIWGYYNSAANAHTATVTWQLANSEGTITIGTQNATVVDATNNTAPDPISQTFEVYGEYKLQAIIGGNKVSEYDINIVKNTDGIEKYVNGMRCELSAMGRSNAEPSSIRKIWEYTAPYSNEHTSTEFNGILWNTVTGWINNALVLRDGAYATTDIKPFVSPQETGATIEVTFETFACTDEDAKVLYCGDPNNGGSFAIYGKKAVMKSRLGADIKTEFQSDRKITISFVINASSKSGITSQGDLMFIQTNGIRERSESYAGESDTFNSNDTLHIGDPEGKCGIRIYSIRIYDKAIERNAEANNYILGTGNISTLLDQNDILTNGIVDIDKLTSKYDTIAITADISQYFSSNSKAEIYGNAWRKNPQNPQDNFDALNVCISHPGQSTLGYSKPQLRLNFNAKKDVILYNYEGNIVSGGRYPVKYGSIPEKKVRLNPNFVDSTCGNAGGFFNMVNDMYQKTQVGNEFVLLNEAQKYVKYNYKTATGKDFPYEIQTCPRAYPCVVIWRPTENDQWSFLSIFAILDEKKSPYKFGQHSIYDKMLTDGTPDPFDFASGLKGNRLWDNENCLHYEIETNGTQLSLMNTLDGFWESDGLINEQVFEREYPDADDLTYDETRACDEQFHRLVKFFVDNKNDQDNFDAHWKEYLDPYKTAAYYVLMMKLALVDSSVRNMQLRTDDGIIWYPSWWDPDVQKGKRNDGPLIFSPRIDRQSKDPDTPTTYAYAGHDSSFWNLLEGCTEFIDQYVPNVNNGLFSAGLNAQSMMQYYSKFTGYFCIRLYNESIESKYNSEYPGNDYLDFNMGNGENHDLWWVADSFKYWDARWSSGSYAQKSFSVRADGAYGKYSAKATNGRGCRLYFKTSEEQYFMWAETSLANKQISSPYHADPKDDNNGEFYFELGIEQNRMQDFGVNNPIVVYGGQSLEVIDYHEIAQWVTELLMENIYDESLGSNLKKLIIGVSKEDMASGKFNPSAAWHMTGLDKMTLLEYLDVQGLKGLSSFATGSFDQLENLRYFYGAGSGLTSFAPHSGLSFTAIELPDTVKSITMTDCSWSSIKFFKPDGNTAYETVPFTLESVYFYNMGQDPVVRTFIRRWISAIGGSGDYSYRHLTLTNILWEGVTYENLMALARIPKLQRNLSGTIQLGQQITSAQYDAIKEAFGENCFTNGAALVISAESSFIIAGASNVLAGESAQIIGVSFPVADEQPKVEFYFKDLLIDPIAQNGEMVYKYKNITLHAESGLLESVEDSTETFSVVIRGENTKTGSFADMEVTINARTHPTSATINGEAMLASMGSFEYTVSFSPNDTTGTKIRDTWSLIGAPSYITINGNGDNKAIVQIIDRPEGEEVSFKIHFKGEYKSGWEVTAEDLEVIYVAVITIMNASHSDSEAAILNALWSQFGSEYMQSRYRLTNAEARKFRTLATEGIVGNENITEFPSLKYFKNLVSVDLSDTGITETLDLSSLSRCLSVNVGGTDANLTLGENANLSSVHYGSPTEIDIENCSSLNIN